MSGSDFNILDEIAQSGAPGLARSDSNRFMRGAKKAVVDAGITAKGAIAALNDDEDALIDVQNQQGDNARYYSKSTDVDNVFDVDSVGEAFNWLGGAGGSAAGSLGTTIVGGGLGGAVGKGIAKKAVKNKLSNLSKKQAVEPDDVNNMVGNAVKQKAFIDEGQDIAAQGAKAIGKSQLVGATAGMVGSSFPQQMGGSALDIYKETGDIKAGAAAITGALQTVPDIFPVFREFKKFGVGDEFAERVAAIAMKSPTKAGHVLRETLKTGSIEGATEMLQEVIGKASLEFLTENKDFFTPKDIKEIINAGAIGFVGGGMMGGPSSAVQAMKSDKPWFKTFEKEQAELKEAAVEEYAATGDSEKFETVKEELKARREKANETIRAEQEDPSIKNEIYGELDADGKSVDIPENDVVKVQAYRRSPESFNAFGEESVSRIKQMALSEVQAEINDAMASGDVLKRDALFAEYQALSGVAQQEDIYADPEQLDLATEPSANETTKERRDADPKGERRESPHGKDTEKNEGDVKASVEDSYRGIPVETISKFIDMHRKENSIGMTISSGRMTKKSQKAHSNILSAMNSIKGQFPDIEKISKAFHRGEVDHIADVGNKLIGRQKIDTSTGEITPVESSNKRSEARKAIDANSSSPSVEDLLTPQGQVNDDRNGRTHAQDGAGSVDAVIEEKERSSDESIYFNQSQGSELDSEFVPEGERDVHGRSIPDSGGSTDVSRAEDSEAKNAVDSHDGVKSSANESSFKPTHQFDDGTLVTQVPGEEGVYQDEQGEYLEADDDEVSAVTSKELSDVEQSGYKKPEKSKSDDGRFSTEKSESVRDGKSERGALGVAKEEKEKTDAAANEAATSPKNDLPEPTEAQKEAGNYKVGRIPWNGLDVSIENPKGSQRKGKDKETDKGVAMFKATKQPNKKSISAKDLDSVIAKVSKQWKSAPEIVVADTFEGLPIGVLQAANEQGASPTDINAVHFGGKVYIVRDSMRNKRQVERALFHEVYGHHGLRGMFGRDIDKKMNQFFLAAGGKKGVMKLAKKYGFENNIELYWQGSKAWNANDRNAMIAEELLAHVAERETGKLQQLALEILGAIKEWLRKNGFAELSTVDRADIALLLKEARQSVIDGGMVEGQAVSFMMAESDKVAKSGGVSSNTRFSLNSPADDLFADVDKEVEAEGLKRINDLRKKSWQYVKDKAHEYSANGFLATVTLRQMVDIGKDAVPMGKTYMDRVEKMLTERNKMQDESAKLALKWQGLNKVTKNRLAHVMHEATMEGVDPSYSKFQTSQVSIVGGMKQVNVSLELDQHSGKPDLSPQRVEANEANLKLLARRKFKLKQALTRAQNRGNADIASDAHKRAVKEWQQMRNAVARDKKNKPKFAQMRRKFVALPGDAQKIFTESRDMYLNRSDRTEKALIDSMERAGKQANWTPEQYKRGMKAIRAEFESARLQGVYFPLFRKGDYFVRSVRQRTDITQPEVYFKSESPIDEHKKDGKTEFSIRGREGRFDSLAAATEANRYWASADAAKASMNSRADLIEKNAEPVEVSEGKWVLKDKMTEPVYTMHTTAAEAERTAKALGADHSDIRFGKQDKVQTSDDFAASGSFLADVFNVMNESGVDDKVKDDVYQVYLQTLPELSQRKHFIHRKKTSGFSENALQAFSNNMGHQAHQISKLEARDDLNVILEDIGEHVKTVDQKDAVLAGNIRDELKLRHDWVMNPTNAGWTNLTSSFGFFMYLGVSPAAALVNLTQTAVVSYPTLAASYGWSKAGKALAKAGSQLNAREVFLEDGAIDKTGLSFDEGKALQAWYDEGVIDRSQAHMLAGIGDSDSFQNSPTYQKWMGKTAHLFHKAEIVNREVTLLAGYRLAREAGLNHDAAVADSSKNTWESHFDYSNANRARLMQGDMAKLLLMFRSYSQHMIYFMLKNAKDWGKGGKEGKKAQSRLLGMLGVTMAMGGVSALPIGIVGGITAGMYSQQRFGTKKTMQGAGAMTGLMIMASLLWDDDEPFDWEAETRAGLREMGGNYLESLVFRGVANAHFGVDISSRVSIDDLLWRSPNRELEGRDLATHYVNQALGPVVGYGAGLFTAKQLASEDHEWRAIEKVVPKFARDVMKTLRYGNEGVLNMRGDAVVDKDLMALYSDDITAWNLLWMAQGLNPEKVTRQYTKTNDIKNKEQHILRRRSAILARNYIAFKENDRSGLQQAIEDAENWNKMHPKAPQITTKTFERSIKTKQRYDRDSVNGANVSKNYRYIIGELSAE